MPQSMMEVESEPQPKSQERSKKKQRKWTFGGLFRRKKTKDSTSESSDSDDAHNHKKGGGFLARRQRRRAANRGSKDVTGSFEHVVMRQSGGSSGNLSEGKRSLKARVEASRDKLRHESSSEEDSPRLPRSHRSSKRLSKDITDCAAIKVLDLESSPRSPRWTAKVVYCESSDYEARYTARTRSATPSPAQSPVTKRAAASRATNARPPKPQPPPPTARNFIDQKSASFDLLPRPKRVPPPPPPRDPQRKIIPPLAYTASFDRPLSYAFENDQPLPKQLTMDHNSNITPYKVHSSSSLENRRPYHYYTDQQPRSRRPIHIARTDQQSSYLSDSQIGRARSHYGSSDWRIPRGSNSSLYDSSDSREGPEIRQLSMVLETQEHAQNRLPQTYNHQPVRNVYSYEDKQHNSLQNGELNHVPHQEYQVNNQRHYQDNNHDSYQRPYQDNNQRQYQDNNQQMHDSMSRKYQDNNLENNHRLYQDKSQQTQNKPNSVNPHRKSNNLEDALDELEAIYKSLQMNDEDPPNSRGFESDSGYYRHIDDMAYRRLNRRDSNGSPDCRVIASQAGSYLLVSPALSPPPFANAPPIVPTPDNEPDITLDDVVYRSLRHANNTLKISDPQPPFGIPLGPVAPAANSDYLHASPKELYRSSFKPRKTPDVVKDDLAYRNLRKDKNSDSLLSAEESAIPSETTMKKKRAARSLSANLLSIIQKENSVLEEKRNSYNEQSNMEKTRSFSDLPDILNCRYKVNRFYADDSDVTPRSSRQFQELPLSTTSTETLTDSKTDVISTNDYCSSRGRPVASHTNKPLTKTDSTTKNRLPSPSRNRSSSSTSPHRTSIPSPQRVSSPSPNRSCYSAEGKIKYSSPTSVNLEKYMQRYNDSALYHSHSSPTKIKVNGVEEKSFDKISAGNQNGSRIVSNKDEPVCVKRPSPVSSPHHEYYRKHSSKQHVTTGEALPTSVISVNTNKYLRDSQQTRTDVPNNNQAAHSRSDELPYQSSPLIYVRTPDKNKSTLTSDNPDVTPLSPTKSNVHNIVGNFNRLITDNSPSKSHLKTVGDHQLNSKCGAMTQPAERSSENKSYTKVYHSSSNEPPRDNLHSLLLKQFENSSDKNKSALKNGNNSSCSSNGILKNVREQSNSVYPSSPSKTNAPSTPKKDIDGKISNHFQIEKQTKSIFYSTPSANESSIIHKQEMKPVSCSKNQPDSSSQGNLYSRTSQFVPISSHVSHSLGNVTNFRAQEPQIGQYKFQANSKMQLANDFKNSKSLPEMRNSDERNAHKLSSSENSPVRINENSGFDQNKTDKSSTSVDNHFLLSGNNSLEVNNLELEPEISSDENELGVLSGNIAIKVLCSNPKTDSSSSSFQITNNTEVQNSTEQSKIKPLVVTHSSATENTVISYSNPALPIKGSSQSHNSESTIRVQLPMQANQSIKDCKVNSEHSKIDGNSNKRSSDDQMEKFSNSEEFQTRNMSSSSQPYRGSSNDVSAKSLEQSTQKTIINHSVVSREEAEEDEILSNDLNKLLSEINSKQEKLLIESSERSQDPPSSTDKRDSVAIGKIIQHKPVKLNTFHIDQEFVGTNNTENDGDVVRSSESMTDLLQELTRSLDQDFGGKEAEKQVQENSSDEALTDFEIASSVSQDILHGVGAETISVVSDLSDSRDCSEICEILQDVAGKLGEGSQSFERCERNRDDETNTTEGDRVDYPSDTDSNAEFVEQIRKTASELSDLQTTTTNQLPIAADRMRSGRAQADHGEERYRQACSDMVQFGYAEKSGECASVEGDGEGVETLKMAAIATPSAEEVRQQRIARYKEERRRQLAAQFGRRDANAVTATQDAASIRTTRTSRLRSAASLTTDINGTARNGVRKDAGLKNSPTLLSSSSESKERSGTSPGMTNSSPRRERDKSAKRKSNLNRQLHSEQVVHSDSALPDDGVRRRSSQTRPASSGSNSSSVGVPSKAAGRPWSALPTPTAASRHNSAASLDSAASSKRLTPPRKSGGGSDRGSTPDRDSDAKRLTPPRKSGGGSDRGSTPDRDSDVSAPRGGRSSITRIPKKISTGSVGGSSSRESSPRHKSSCTKLSVSSQPSVDIGSPAAASTPASRVVVNGGVTHKDTTKSSKDTTNTAVGNHCAEVVSPAPQPPSTPPIAPSSHQQPSRWSWHTTTPVSILKRKTSQEEAPNQQSVSTAAGAVPPPVTFSPSVVDPPPSRRQGILKKHRSLDEAEVMRRRSSSPADVSEVATDFRPILKNQRRSSLEELRHRTQSPEPQSILKRKTSREESVENSSSEPHSILKRKSSSVDSEGSSSHITIAESVILSITGGVPPPSDDHVKPILKKKSFSGEDPPPEAGNASDVPRPILKKKPSVDVEDFEERHPMKPILKLRRDSMSVEEASEVEVSSVSLSPILKRTEESSSVNTPEPRLRSVKKTEESSSFNTPELRLRSVKKTEDFNTPEPRLRSVFWRNCEKSSTDLTGSASNTCFSKRRSLDISSVREEDRVVHRPCRPGSVAERIMNMESFLAAEGCQDLPPKSPTVTSSVGALPKRRDRDRFLTQPITAQEISDSKNWVPDSHQPTRPEEVDEERIIAASTSSTSASNNDCAQQLKYSDLLSDVCVKSSDLSSAVPHNMADGECEAVSSAVTQANMADDESEAAACNGGLVRSKSVSARASMFEAQMKQAVEENKPRRFNKGSINRRSNQEGFARFATQPVTFDEVEEARRQNKDAQGGGGVQGGEGEGEEADPSKLTLAERVKLFSQQKSEAPSAPLLARSRSARFKTQPITGDEVTTAKGIVNKPRISKSTSGILVSGILKNIAVKSGGKPPSLKSKVANGEDDRIEAENDSNEDECSRTRSILKQSASAARIQQLESDKSAMQVRNSDNSVGSASKVRGALKRNDSVGSRSSLHSILKTNTSKSASSSDDESDDGEFEKSSELVDLLHKVEAAARDLNKERAKSLTDTSNLRKSLTDTSVMNGRSLEEVRRRRRDGEDVSEGDSSSGGREVRRINNEAIARRRQATIARQAAEKVKTVGSPGQQNVLKSKSQTAVFSEDERMVLNGGGGGGGEALMGGLRRCLTQPMPPQACDQVDEPTMTIAQRLAALQKSGESDWRKRISRLSACEDLPSININEAQEVLRQQLVSPPPPSVDVKAETINNSSAADRLSSRLDQLQHAAQGWKKRVEPSDAVQFSVAGRMALSPSANVTPLSSPAPERKKRTPRAATFKGKHFKEVQSTPTSPEGELSLPPEQFKFKRSVSVPNQEDDELEDSLSPTDDGETDRQTAAAFAPRVSVPKQMDDDFSAFFPAAHAQTSDRIDVDLDCLKCDTRQMLVLAKRVKVVRRHGASANPLRVLAARTDLCTDYIEIKSGVAQREMRRLNVEKLSKSSPLAVEALAGLASKEDFTAVALRKATAQSVHASVAAMLPYRECMLLHIKGRRHVQTRLVRPHYTSVNQGDSYVLVTSNELFHYVGEFSNVIEKSRSADIAQHILTHKDLGCSAPHICSVGSSGTPRNQSRFWQLLGAGDDLPTNYKGVEAGSLDEDEVYEAALVDTNMIYSVEDDALVPLQAAWGSIPRIEILNPAKILVLDFGTELYVWMGKNATLDKRKSAINLAEELWSQGYDYSDCDISPISAAERLGSHSHDADDEVAKKGERPSWGLMAKVTQHMETVLFREKFLDWPDFTRVIRAKRKASKDRPGESLMELKPCDAEEIMNYKFPAPDLELEGSHLGRGRTYFDEETRRHFEITTQSLKVWHINEFTTTEVPEDSCSQFFTGDSYVIRWIYNITVTGRELSGQPSKHAGSTGRDRCVYFTWQGSGATLNDQGAAALLTVQLDRERGAQVRVPQHAEPPALLALFHGAAVFHQGRQGDKRQNDEYKLFICKGQENEEAVLVEVACSIRSLRSKGSFLLVQKSTGQLYLWHGSKSLPHCRQVAAFAVDKLTDGDMAELGLGHLEEVGFKEIEEGSEPKEFFAGLGGCNRQLYVSLLNSDLSYDWTPRLFHMTSVLGQFTAVPVVPPCGHPTLACPFPYIQNDLYSASQPAMFLLDAEDVIWLWQGWLPSVDESGSGSGSGSDADDADVALGGGSGSSGSRSGVRWQAERRAAMATALALWRAKKGASESKGAESGVLLAYAGLEPLQFTNLFPDWTDRDDIAEINIADGRKPGEWLSVEAELARLTRSTYPLAQLLQRPLPEGVDPTRLENYLSPNDFQELLGMSKEEFFEMPTWKQTNLKKTSGLF